MTAENIAQQTDSNPNQGKRTKRKKLKIAAIVVATIFVLLIIIGVMADITPKYEVSDLVPVTNNNISFSRPVQWQDASYADNLKKDFGLDMSNTSIFGDKVSKDKDGNYGIANAFVAFGQASNDTVDSAIFKNPAFKPKFEEIMNKQLNQDSFKSSTCLSVSNYGITYSYDYNNFPVAVAIKLNCQLSDADKAKYNAESVEMRMAMVIASDGKTYTYTLIAGDKSWAKNEPVYFQMMRDLRALK